ncbi:MAG: hypothetical protein ACOH2Q_22610 [Rhodococcus sp. (in: high G+C Gram-positive bacteria)]
MTECTAGVDAQRPETRTPTRDLYRLSDVAERLGSLIHHTLQSDPVITGISDNSRLLSAGDLYVALPGNTLQDMTFERGAFDRGAAAVVPTDPRGYYRPSS